MLQALKTKLGQWAEALASFRLALRVQDGMKEDRGNRADVLHGMALVSSHLGACAPPPPFLFEFILWQVTVLRAPAT